MEDDARASFQLEQLAGQRYYAADGAAFRVPSAFLPGASRTPKRSSMIGNHKDAMMHPGMESTRADAPNGYSRLDQTPSVDSFFSSIRVPASFLAGTSFSQMFSIDNDDQHNNSVVQNKLQTACIVCQGFAFVFSMNVIVMSSSALTRMLTANFDPFAENAYEMLFREFHYEFLIVRWSFNVSLYGFLAAVTFKILYEFELFNVQADGYDRDRMELGIAVLLLMLAFYIHLTAYVNQTLIGWKNMYAMTLDLLKILVERGKYTFREPLSLVLAGLGMIFLVLAFIPGAQI